MNRLYKVPFTIRGECYVWAKNLDDAADEVEFAPADQVVESNYSSCETEIDVDEIEEVPGLPSNARAL